jgi:hypothetical protein
MDFARLLSQICSVVNWPPQNAAMPAKRMRLARLVALVADRRVWFSPVRFRIVATFEES